VWGALCTRQTGLQGNSGDFSFSDENNALKSGYDPVSRTWPSWIEKTGIEPARLPRVVSAGSRTGTILSSIADRFRLPRDVAIVAGTTDGCAAFLASGADDAGDGVTSLGTTMTLKLLSATPVFAPSYGIYSHRIGDQWLAGGASNAGGVVLAQYFSSERIAELSKDIPQRASGLDYYPLPKAGERFPINDPHLQPRMTPRPESDVAFLHGMLEGFTRIEQQGYAKLAVLGASSLRSLRTVGGGARNEAWTRMRMEALGVPALLSLSDHAAVGTARLAWRGIDAAA
jgi:D-ribulokinase